MAQTFTPERLVEMAELFEGPMVPLVKLQTIERFYRQAENAGVADVARDLGLTLSQWEKVKDPIRTLRAVVLADA